MATPYTNFVFVTDASGGAQRCSGTNGDMNAILNWVLPLAGWTRAFNNAGTFESVFTSPSAGLYLYCRHDSAASGFGGFAVIRMAESATSYTEASLVNPYPTVAQLSDANSNWMLSSSASTTARSYFIIAWERGIIFVPNYSGVLNTYEPHFAVGCSASFEKQYSTDIYPGCVFVRATGTATGVFYTQPVSTTIAGSPTSIFFQRDITGTVLSSRGQMYLSGSQFGTLANGPVIRGGYGNQIVREKVLMTDTSGSVSGSPGANAILKRFALPNFWNLIHSSLTGVSVTDVINDSTYDPSASFKFLAVNSVNGALLETTNTWQGYPGG